MNKCLVAEQTNRNFNNNKQYDCVEFLQSLFEHFWKEQPWNENIEDRVFGGLIQESLQCKCGNIKKLPIQKMTEVMHLQVKGKSTQNCLDEFLSRQEVESKCPACNGTQCEKTVEILCTPSTIILHLLRFLYDENLDATLKLDCPIFCPSLLTLPNGSTFILNSVINHIGESSTSGHYNIVLFDEEHNKLILLDDSQITEDIVFDQDMAQNSYVATYTRI